MDTIVPIVVLLYIKVACMCARVDQEGALITSGGGYGATKSSVWCEVYCHRINAQMRCLVCGWEVTIPPSCGIIHGAPVGGFDAWSYSDSA
jgi:hypothetical protein